MSSRDSWGERVMRSPCTWSIDVLVPRRMAVLLLALAACGGDTDARPSADAASDDRSAAVAAEAWRAEASTSSLTEARCRVTVTISGEYSGRWAWSSASLNPLRPGPAGKQWGYTNSLSRNGYFMINNESGHFEVVHSGPVRPGGGGAGIRSVWLYPPHPEGWSVRSRSPTEGTFQLTEYTEDRMAGTFSGTVIAVPPTPDGRWYGEIPTASVEVAFDLDPRPGGCASPVPRSPR